MAVKSNVLRALKRFTSCDVGDALVKLGVPQGGYLSGLTMYSPGLMSPTAKIFGPAYTVKMVHAADKAPPTPKVHFADAIPQDSVVFVSQPKGLISACWGGLMSTRAQKRGAAGVIIDGKFRDVNEHRELGIGENIENGGEVVINPGDYILGDADGVVVVPPDSAEECVRLCQERYEIDEETRRCLERGDEIGSTIKRLRK